MIVGNNKNALQQCILAHACHSVSTSGMLTVGHHKKEKQMKKIPLILFFTFIFTSILFSQNSKRTNVWYFGRNAGIDFNTTPITPLLDGALNIWEGCATICDTLGEILIYTDGRKIWNKNHQVIPGATNLGGDNSATQSGIIVPYPNSDDLFYVFSVDDQGGNGGLQYAVVDMTQNGGLGGLLSSNNVLLGQCSEKVTAIPHCNKQDFWLIAHEYGSNNFVVWEITNSGVSSSPNIISIGSIHSATSNAAIGYMKSSPDGSRLALGVYAGDFFELFDFDNETGELTNPLTFTNTDFNKPYGVEFSPDGKRLYLAGTQNTPIIFQINLDLPTVQEIQNSLTVVGQGSSSYFGSIQNAPNGKIYVAKDNGDYLSVIHNPNELGIACNFIEDDFYLGGKESALGLPNLIPSFFEQEPSIELSETINFCGGTADIQAITDISGDSIVYQWYFESNLIPNQSTTQIQVDSSGEYEFEVLVFLDCQSNPSEYSQTIIVTLPEFLDIQDVQLNHPLCGLNNGSITIEATGGTLPYQYSFDGGETFQANGLGTNLGPGIYEIVVQDDNGCEVNQAIELVSTIAPIINDIQITNTSCGNEDGTITIIASNGTGPLEYAIDGLNFQQSNSFNNLNSGFYIITVIDSLVCSDEANEEIEASNSPSINLIQSIPTTCNNDNGSLELLGAGGIPPLEYSIDGSNFQTSGLFEDLSQGDYTVIIQDFSGCIDSAVFQVESEIAPTISDIELTPTTCWEDNGTIQITISGGTGLEYSINGVDFQSSNFFENLAGDNYIVTIKDDNNCLDTQMVMIELIELPLAQSIETISASCGEANGSITIEANGGTGFEYSINANDFQQDNLFSNLYSGIYTVIIKNGNDCISTNEVQISDSPQLVISAIDRTHAVCGEDNGSFSIDVQGGTGQIQVSLNGSSFQSDFSFDNLPAGIFQIVILDEAGCEVDTLITINQENCQIFIPNAFSPNDDGFNDVFKVYPHSDFKGDFRIFRIYNRWGALMYEAQNFSPENSGWNGTHKGKKLGVGVYVYFIEIEYENGDKEILEGDITIIK